MEILTNGFSTNGYFNFSLSDEEEIDTKIFFEDSKELAKLTDEILDKYDDHPSINYTGDIFRYFRIFKRLNRSEQGRGANELNIVLEYEGENCYIPSGKSYFLKCINYIFKKDFSMECFEFIHSYKRRPNVMAWCRTPEICNR